MPTHRETIELEAGAQDAERACVVALRGLGWTLESRSSGRIEAFEDPTPLNCHTAPSSIVVEIEGRGEDSCTLALECSGPGLAVMVRGRLQRQARALVTRLES